MRRRLALSVANASELMRLGRLAPDYAAPYEIVDRDTHYRLRHYFASGSSPTGVPLLLVPPLMVTAEVYDVAPEMSAVSELAARGVDVYVVDFGAPEHEEGGMTRTLPDHVRAIDRAIDRLVALTGRKIHLAGYSQGGMFAYQTAAYRRSRDIASIATYGAPVDVHRNVPALRSDAVNAVVHAAEPAISRIVSKIEGLPSVLTSTGFKILSTRKELAQRLDFLRNLHDRNALVRREARRRFLGGAGFVAWPGPAFRDFVSDFIVHNRMLSGGFVIDGRTLTLADITCPILALVGRRDDMARPAAVRAIARAAPNAAVTVHDVDAGHFGLVVGSRAASTTWPLTASWIRSIEGLEPSPAALTQPVAAPPFDADDEPDGAGFEVDVDIPVFVDNLRGSAAFAARTLWTRFGDVVASAGDAFDSVRFREPRLRRLLDLDGHTRVSASLALAEQAAKHPDATFFLWQSRAFSYRESNDRVTSVAKGLHVLGVRAGERVAVAMSPRPSLLSVTTALGRIGAVAVIVPPDLAPAAVASTLARLGVSRVVCDPAHATAYRDDDPHRAVLVLGGGNGARPDFGERVVDMERIDPHAIAWPPDVALDALRGADVAMILVRRTADGDLRAREVTNRRWALSAWGAAAACTLKPEDTVYCPVPLHHPTALLVGVGAAIAGGARLALGDVFSPDRFFAEVRRYGATVVLYAGEMLRPLAAGPKERDLPVRTFAGSGMRPDLAARLADRFGARTLEFYASTTERAVLANASLHKLGALGRPLPGSAPVAVVRFDVLGGAPLRDARGSLVRASIDEPGLLAVRLDDGDPRAESASSPRVGLLEGDGPWIVSRDVVRVDADGDHWYVDAVAGHVRRGDGVVSTRALEDAIYTLDEVDTAAVYALPPTTKSRGAPILVAAIASRSGVDPARLASALAALPGADWPSLVFAVDHVPLGDGYRPDKHALIASGTSPPGLLRTLTLDGTRYV